MNCIRMLLVVCFLGVSCAAQADAPVGRGKTKAARSHTWLSMSGGAYDGHDSDGVGGTFGFYGGGGRGIFGVRLAAYADAAHLFFDADAPTLKEGAVMFGGFLDRSNSVWGAIGLARISARGEEICPDQNKCIAPGLPIELVFSPHFSVIGLELRLAGNLNDVDSFFTFQTGWRFGDLD